MISNVMPSIVQMEKENLKELTTEVRETFATDINLFRTIKRKKFGIVDLWNCQRNVRTAVSKRRY